MPYDANELYPAKAGSPYAYLAESITEDQVSIRIDDTSKLPPGPALALIGSGQYFEVIFYENIETDTLVGVEREIEGTKRAWDKGVAIACVFTAQHLTAIHKRLRDLSDASGDLSDDLESHLNEIASTEELGHVLAKTDTNGRILTNIKTITGASYTIQVEDIGEWLRMNRSSAQTIIFPKDTLPIGAMGLGVQVGTGKTTLTAAAGVTLLKSENEVRTIGQGAVFGWIVEAENTIRVFGRLEAV